MNHSRYLLLAGAVIVVTLTGCMQPKGTSIADKRAYVENKREETLRELYRDEPQTEQIIEQAAGYGVFSNIGTQILWTGTKQGYGVVVNNETGKHTYMRMGGLKGGIGIGIQGYRAVFVFNDKNVMHRFITEGWEFGGAADATATTEEDGMAIGGQETIERKVIIYQLTDAGVKAAVTLGGSKYWPDKELNR